MNYYLLVYGNRDKRERERERERGRRRERENEGVRILNERDVLDYTPTRVVNIN